MKKPVPTPAKANPKFKRRSLLTDPAKDFAVLCFARFMRPKQVIAALEERYGVVLDKRAVQMYDPTTAKGATLGKKRKIIFEHCRKTFLKELDAIPIANRAVRLQQLQNAFDNAIDKGATGFAMKLLEQAAKEAGGSFTAERTLNLTGKLEVENITEDEMRNGLAAAIAAALEAERERLAPPTKH